MNNICKNCKHIEIPKGGLEFAKCSHPKSKVHVDLVTGQETKTFCSIERRRYGLGCGIKGHWFEPKE